jgi:hypothetical protein
MRLRFVPLLGAIVLLVVSCASVLTAGRDFTSPKPGSEIRNGTTGKPDLLRMFGEPTEIGVKDGDQTWTWYYFKKSTGKDPDLSKRLEVTFDARGIAKSYSFSSNFPEDMKNR